MSLFVRRRSLFPLTPVNKSKITNFHTGNFINMINADVTDTKTGGLFLGSIWKGLTSTQKIDNILISKVGSPYTPDVVNEMLSNALFTVKHSMLNPSLYNLKRPNILAPERFAMVAIATPVDVFGTILPYNAPNIYGWEVAIYTGDRVDIDVFISDGEIVTGTASFTRSAMTRMKFLPYLRFASQRQITLWALYSLMSGQKVPHSLFSR